jgi:hypothetical protein
VVCGFELVIHANTASSTKVLADQRFFQHMLRVRVASASNTNQPEIQKQNHAEHSFSTHLPLSLL